jgi:hypothetical protein
MKTVIGLVAVLLIGIGSALGQAPASIAGLTFRSFYQSPPLSVSQYAVSVDFSGDGTYSTRLSTGGIYGGQSLYRMPATGTYTYTVISPSQATLICNPPIILGVLPPLDFANASQGTIIVSNDPISPFSISFVLTPTSGAASGRAILNTSCLFTAKQGQPITLGFVIGGAAPWREILIRAIGPSLKQFGITNFAADPVYALANARLVLPSLPGETLPFGGDGKGWSATLESAATVAAENARAGAFSLGSGSDDKADVLLVSPGAYTITVNPTTPSGEGVELIEVYEVP